MKLFIDTSNDKTIFAIVNDNNIIESFSMKENNKDVVEKINYNLDVFLNKNNININEIENFMITIGPGSFTGVKVALNIVRTINIIKSNINLEIISTFKLLSEKNKKGVAIKFGKNKFYYKDNSFFKKATKISKEELKENIVIGYENFSKEKLQEKIDNKSFKIIDNLDKVKIKYMTNF